ncbi:MAG: squalene/phytoene synthase family protein [Gemmatimonadota bacterium]|jgi:farnesyl-diphosphate farnesyltransferase|nr:squalene/phytoene synthase family protein [Gemmatimonadota bacterium]
MNPQMILCHELLPTVSRTFALNIRVLPHPLRTEVTVAYLLFRIVDTMEDAPGLYPEERGSLFDAFLERLDGATELTLRPSARLQLLESVTPRERRLMESADQVFAAFESLPDRRREAIAAHVAETAGGMSRLSREKTRNGLFALETPGDLDEYCYHVAGTIGIMLTRLFTPDGPASNAPRLRRMTALGANFGRGLQLVNILKGIASDRRDGRCFLPAEMLARHGVTPARMLEAPSRAGVLAVAEELAHQAARDLDDALRYTTLLPRTQPRLRVFCLWPLFAAMRTLEILRDGTLTARPGRQPRIRRRTLFREMSVSTAIAMSNAALRARFGRLSGRLFPGPPRPEIWSGTSAVERLMKSVTTSDPTG